MVIRFNASGIGRFNLYLLRMGPGLLDFNASGIEQHSITQINFVWYQNYSMPGTAERFNSNNRVPICDKV